MNPFGKIGPLDTLDIASQIVLGGQQRTPARRRFLLHDGQPRRRARVRGDAGRRRQGASSRLRAVTAREVASEAYGTHIAQFMEQLKTLRPS